MQPFCNISSKHKVKNLAVYFVERTDSLTAGVSGRKACLGSDPVTVNGVTARYLSGLLGQTVHNFCKNRDKVPA